MNLVSTLASALSPVLAMHPIWIAGVVVLVLAAFFFVIVLLRYIGLWIQCLTTRAGISLINLVAMSLRKVDPRVIVGCKIMAVQAGLALETRDLESHYLAGGHPVNVVRALIAADRANIELNFKTAAAIDLAGRNIQEAVALSVLPKVIDVPTPETGKTTIDAVAKDGIQVKAKARVTVRANLERLVGGATEETIIARVGEGIVTTIGSAQSYKDVLENPDSISKRVLEKGLDAGTAFEILSIDIADVDIGDNVGARLQAAQAQANLRMFQAEAEQRRAVAAAREQEMRALVEENRAKVVLAEAEVPKAIAEAFRSGNLGIMDYYRMKNIQADTGMRDSIGHSAEPPKPDHSDK